MTRTTDPASRPQPDKFRDLARELGCDEDEAAFEDQVRRVALPDRSALSHQLDHARAERDAWAGKPGEHHAMASALVRGLEEKLSRLDATGKPAEPQG